MQSTALGGLFISARPNTCVGTLNALYLFLFGKTIFKLFPKEAVKMSQRVEDHLACELGQITPCLWQMLITDSMKFILIQVWLFSSKVFFRWQIWASFAVFPDAAGKTMPVFFVKWFEAVWMKWVMQELDIYFPVSNHILSVSGCLDQSYQWLILWRYMGFVFKIGIPGSMNRALL